MKKVVLVVEGEGDVESAPTLTKRVITEKNGWSSVSLDPNPIRVGDITKLVKHNYRLWHRMIGVSRKRRDLGGILVLLDGDIKKVNGNPFCAATVAKDLAAASHACGAGNLFSVAVTFACQEFESWGIASSPSLSGLEFQDGQKLSDNLTPPCTDLEKSPRNAKGWLSDNMVAGSYNEVRHQKTIAANLDFELLRRHPMRSFQRFENSIDQLLQAISNNNHVTTPC